jgi:hypothetical protein
MSASDGRVSQLRSQHLSEDIMKLIDTHGYAWASIKTHIDRRAVAFCLRYLGAIVTEYSPNAVRLTKKEASDPVRAANPLRVTAETVHGKGLAAERTGYGNAQEETPCS